MKTALLSLLLTAFTVCAYGQDESARHVVKLAKLTFDKADFHFGDIFQGQEVSHTFRFHNSGEAPLLLTNIAVTCGCTATDWPREAVAPGAQGEIKVTFNSEGKSGIQNKIITVVSNAANPQERIKIMANVLPRISGGK